jgi:inorganic pyrophosphatase
MSKPDDSRLRHMVNDVPYKAENGLYQMVVEIPAGTNEKWQTDATTGQFYHDEINEVPRVINFLPYPMNYGMLPQTLLSRAKGGMVTPPISLPWRPLKPEVV